MNSLILKIKLPVMLPEKKKIGLFSNRRELPLGTNKLSQVWRTKERNTFIDKGRSQEGYGILKVIGVN